MPRRSIAVAVLATICSLLVACGNSPGSGGSTGASPTEGAPAGTVSAADLTKKVPLPDVPGVTDDTIRVGSVVTKSSIIGGDFESAAKGAEAYFAMVNDAGGIYGRRIELVKVRDDQLIKNQQEVQGLLAQDDVFAVVPVATPQFTGAQELVDQNVPTFGWNINPEWSPAPNMFGQNGSYICFTCTEYQRPNLAKMIGATKVGLVGYGVSSQSKDCVKGIDNSFTKYPTAKVVYEDAEVPFGSDFKVQVSKMKDAGVDLVMSCIDHNGTITLAKELKAQGVKAVQYLQEGYGPDLIENFADLFEGSVVLVQAVPNEVEQKPKGLVDYQTWTSKKGVAQNDASMAGWLAAANFVEGLRQAGPEFDRQKVIDGLNRVTAFNADGLLPDIDWTRSHDQRGPRDCAAFVKVQGGKFVAAFGQPGKPFICFPTDPPTAPEAPTYADH